MVIQDDSLDISFLRMATVFSPLPNEVLSKLLVRGQVRRFRSGELVFKKGDPTDDAFVIKSGIVEICRIDPESNTLKVVAYLGEGESIGEMVLFTGSPRSSIARVPEEAELFSISRTSMIELCREEPDLALYFCRLFASRLESWVKKGRRQEGQRHLQGNLKFFDLATIMQTLGDTQATGTLIMRNELGRIFAELDFAEGRLRYAKLGHLRGEHAFYQLFQPPPEGTFLFQSGQHLEDDPGPKVDQSVVSLLMEAVRLQDEWNVRKDAFADPDKIYLPTADEMQWQDDGSIVVAFDIWSLLHRAMPFSQLVLQLPYSTGTVLEVLDILHKSKQIR